MYNGEENHGIQPWSFRSQDVIQPAGVENHFVQNGSLPVPPHNENDSIQNGRSWSVLPSTINNYGNTSMRNDSSLPKPVFTITPPLVFHTTSIEEDLGGNRNQLQDPSEKEATRRHLMDRYFAVDTKLSLTSPGSFFPPPPLQLLLDRMPEYIDRIRLRERLSVAAAIADNNDHEEGTENNSDKEGVSLDLSLRPY